MDDPGSGERLRRPDDADDADVVLFILYRLN